MTKFHGQRNYPDRVLPVSAPGNKFTGLFLTSRHQIGDLSWNSGKGPMMNWTPPPRSDLHQFVNFLKQNHSVATHEDMVAMFYNWPANAIENWAVDFHSHFMLSYDIFYDAQNLETTISIQVQGVHDLDWREYSDSYQQAKLMYKLSENI